MGFVLTQQRKIQEGLIYYNKNLKISLKLQAMKSSDQHLRFVGTAKSNVGSLFLRTKRPKEALPLLTDSLFIFQDLLKKDNSVQNQKFMAKVKELLGDVHSQTATPERAEAFYQSSWELRKSLFDAESSYESTLDLRTVNLKRAKYYTLLGCKLELFLKVRLNLKKQFLFTKKQY